MACRHDTSSQEHDYAYYKEERWDSYLQITCVKDNRSTLGARLRDRRVNITLLSDQHL